MGRIPNVSSGENFPTSSNADGHLLSRYGDRCPADDAPAEDELCAKCGGRSLCGGLGYVRQDLPVGHPDFGKLFRCPQLPVDPQRRETLRKLGNLEAFIDKRFDNFFVSLPLLTPVQVQSLHMALTVAQDYAADPRGWLLLEGSYGVGKTHLAAAIANQRLEHEEAVLFITTPDLLDHLRSTYGPSSEIGYDDLFDRIRNAPLLVLDDLGVENPSAWAQEKLFQLLNHRYTRRLPTVITTNVDLETLDPRIRSRMLDNTLIRRLPMQAPDYRTPARAQVDQISDLHLYDAMRFDTFDPERGLDPAQRDNLTRALALTLEFADRPAGWLVLLGTFGCGKTHLAAAIANVQQERGTSVLFVTVPDLFDYLRTAFKPEVNTSFDRRFTLVKNAPLLILDDLGVENPSRWAQEKLFQILNHRYLTRLPTVITTSKALEELDERMQTRLLDRRLCLVYALQAPPYVKRMKLK